MRPLGGAKTFYGMRQNMDTDNADYRRYAKRLITNLVEHYKDNPYVIGWQIDNETASYGASNDDVFAGFVKHLKEKFGTTDNLNKALVPELLGRGREWLGEHADTRQRAEHGIQAGVVTLGADAGHGFSGMAGCNLSASIAGRASS